MRVYFQDRIHETGLQFFINVLKFLTMLTKTKKANAIKATRISPTDTGSPEAQVSILTKKIEELAKHLKKNNKDNHSRRGLLGMVADRQSHLSYLERKDVERYKKLVKKLGLKSRLSK